MLRIINLRAPRGKKKVHLKAKDLYNKYILIKSEQHFNEVVKKLKQILIIPDSIIVNYLMYDLPVQRININEDQEILRCNGTCNNGVSCTHICLDYVFNSKNCGPCEYKRIDL